MCLSSHPSARKDNKMMIIKFLDYSHSDTSAFLSLYEETREYDDLLNISDSKQGMRLSFEIYN